MFARAVRCVVFAGVLVMAGCSRATAIDPAAEPIVKAIELAPTPRIWSFDYRPASPSPFVSCLNGIDRVSGLVDLDVGVVVIEPDRSAPMILVIDTALLVAQDFEVDRWWRVMLDSSLGSAQLVGEFGEIAADFIETGLEDPDPNMTALAFIGIAEEIVVDVPSPGLDGETIVVTLREDLYLNEIEVGGDSEDREEAAPIPVIRITVEPSGLVVAFEVAIAGQDDEAHGDGYVILFDYPESIGIPLPAASQVTDGSFDSIDYPSPSNSCQFES